MARVLVFYQYYCTREGSWSTRYYEFSRRWAATGHDVTIVTSIYDRSDLRARGFVSRYTIEGTKILAFGVRLSNTHGVLRRLWSFLVYSVLSCWYAMTLPADVVIASSGPISTGLPGLVARWLRRRRFIFEVRDLWTEGAIQLGVLRNRFVIAAARAFERLCYRSADVVVALSPGMAESVKRMAPETEVALIPNSSDLDLFSPARPVPSRLRSETKGAFVVLYAGTLGLANGNDDIMGLAAELARRGVSDVRIVVLGDGRERAVRESEARERGLDNIMFVGLKSKLEVADWHAAAAVTLCVFRPHPVLATASPNKLFDSLAAGRPVLNNTDGWIRDLLDRSGAGITFPAGDVNRAADAVLQLRDDAATSAAMGKCARALAEREFSRDDLARRFSALFEE